MKFDRTCSLSIPSSSCQQIIREQQWVLLIRILSNLNLLGIKHELTFTVPMSLSCRPIQNKTAAWAPCNDTGSFSEKYWCARMGTRSRIWNAKCIEIWNNVFYEKDSFSQHPRRIYSANVSKLHTPYILDWIIVFLTR